MKRIFVFFAFAALAVVLASCSKRGDAVDYAPENADSIYSMNLTAIASNPLADNEFFKPLVANCNPTGADGKSAIFVSGGDTLCAVMTFEKFEADNFMRKTFERLEEQKSQLKIIAPEIASKMEFKKGKIKIDDAEYESVTASGLAGNSLTVVAISRNMVQIPSDGKLLKAGSNNPLVKDIDRNAVFSAVGTGSITNYGGKGCTKVVFNVNEKNGDSISLNAVLTYVDEDAASAALTDFDNGFQKGDAPAFIKKVALFREGNVVTASLEEKYTVIISDLDAFRKRRDEFIRERIEAMKKEQASKALPAPGSEKK